MGNSSSTDVEEMSAENCLPNVSLDKLLDKLSTHTVEEVAAHLMRLELNSEEKLSILSKKIHLRAIGDRNFCSKYVKLVKILSSVSCQQIETRREITFKDIFVIHSIQQFGSIRTSSESRVCLARFYGDLFVEGLVTSTLISYWINSLNDQKELQDKMLDTIKEKVAAESRAYPEDQNIRALKTKLQERRILHVDSSGFKWTLASGRAHSPELQDHTPNLRNSVFFFDGQPDVSKRSCQETNHVQLVPVNQNLQIAESQLAEDFRSYLINTQQQPAPTINLSRFKASTDIEREKCAKIMLQRAIQMPANIEKYADIAREVVTVHSVAAAKQKNFAGYLYEACEKEIESSLQHQTKNWNHIKTLGVFVGHLYLSSCTKLSLLKKWIDGVEGSISIEGGMASCPAHEILVAIFEIALPKMKATSPSQHQEYIEKLKLWERALESKTTVASVSSTKPMPASAGPLRKTLSTIAARAAMNLKPVQLQRAAIASHTTQSNVFDQLHNICNKINICNHQQILKEISTLSIRENEENLRKVANVLLQRGMFTTALRPTVCEILLNFPKQFKLQINGQEFMKQVKQSILRQINKIRIGTNCSQKSAMHMINFIKELHARSLIDCNVIEDFVMGLTLNDSCSKPINFFMLVQTVLVFKDSFNMMDHSSVVELILKEHLLDKLPDNEQNDVRIALGIVQSTKACKERIAAELHSSIAPRPVSISPSPTSKGTPKANQSVASFTTDWRLQNVDQLNSYISSLNTGSSSAMRNLALQHFEMTVGHVDFVAHVKLAQMIEKKFADEKNPYDTLFKYSLIKKVQASFEELFNKQEPNNLVGQVRLQARALVKFIGELYKIEWIDGEELHKMVKALVVHDDFMLESFRILLQIISISLAKNSEAEMCLELLQSLNTVTSREKILQARNSLVIGDIKSTLEDVIALCKKL